MPPKRKDIAATKEEGTAKKRRVYNDDWEPVIVPCKIRPQPRKLKIKCQTTVGFRQALLPHLWEICVTFLRIEMDPDIQLACYITGLPMPFFLVSAPYWRWMTSSKIETIHWPGSQERTINNKISNLPSDIGPAEFFETKSFRKRNGQLHCPDAPAIIHCDGTKMFYEHGSLHRAAGEPAVVFTTGTRKWYVRGLLHREDGPAIEYASGKKMWYRRDHFIVWMGRQSNIAKN